MIHGMWWPHDACALRSDWLRTLQVSGPTLHAMQPALSLSHTQVLVGREWASKLKDVAQCSYHTETYSACLVRSLY